MANGKTFRVESGITPPTRHTNQRYPFTEMEVGQSFFILDREMVRPVSTAAYNYAKVNNKKFSIRKYGDGHRCWRVA